MAKYLLYPIAILPEFSTFVRYSFLGAGQVFSPKGADPYGSAPSHKIKAVGYLEQLHDNDMTNQASL